tara:strand:+ start:18125 stop:18505 length:381 start_codon:yes stop_codon:yes gene_type:complete
LLTVGFFLCKIEKTFKQLEESELNPSEEEKTESFTNNSNNQFNKKNNDDKSESLDKLEINGENIQNNTEKQDSLFKKILENGFDGVTTNPNYKLLALLIILLINLSLFFLVGNLGKTFLKNSGILG